MCIRDRYQRRVRGPTSAAMADFGMSNDPFAEGDDFEEGGGLGANKGNVHIRIQQRNGRKSLTTCQGLLDDLDIKRILKAVKKTFNCNGTIVKDDNGGEVMQLQGDQRKNIFDFLTNEKICEPAEIKIHGF
eukprot:TRINITY_DN125_c0_g1_i1.p1 TRINITY_DN125_c0_g1~~TRINITY_DN125_c0_g1_i1.p1  ORF type:complete len:131 (+),score=34.99 TRINITY_DN125_c0_g1_i1:132-524(+)